MLDYVHIINFLLPIVIIYDGGSSSNRQISWTLRPFRAGESLSKNPKSPSKAHPEYPF